MTTIGINTIGSASRLLDALLKKHAEEIDKAYLKAEKSFKVDLSVIFNPAEGGGIDMQVGISFIKERCKDAVKGQVKENQDELFKNNYDLSDDKETTDIDTSINYPVTIQQHEPWIEGNDQYHDHQPEVPALEPGIDF